MTIASAVSKVTLNGNGSTTSFPFGFKVWKAEDLEVSITDASGVVSVVTNWGVALNPSGGGTVAYPTSGPPLPTGHKITIARSMDFLQDVDLVSGTRWDPEVVETALDRATAERQQLKERLDRAVTIPISSSTTPEQFADDLFTARDEAAASASSAAASVATAQVAANSVGVLSASGTLTAGQDTITLPWAYDVATGNIAVFLGGVKQVRSTLTFVDSTHVKVGAAVTESTPYEVTSVTLSAESVLTGLRDQCVTAKIGAETAKSGAEIARAGAETAETNAEAALAALLLVVSPDIGKYNTYRIINTPGQTFATGVLSNIITTGTNSGDLNVIPNSGYLGWTIQESGTYRFDFHLPILEDGTVKVYANIYLKRNRSGAVSNAETLLFGLPTNESVWLYPYMCAVSECQAGDIMYFAMQVENTIASASAGLGYATITRIR